MPTISLATKRLIQKNQEWHQSMEAKESATTLHVDEVASAVATFYEKIRGIVDWREEHLLRKSAIERILKRRLLVAGEDPSQMAEPFVLELIRGGHFPNDSIPETKISEVQRSINKYTFLIDSAQNLNQKELLEFQDWILGISACETEELLSPPSKERALIDYITELMQERIELSLTITETSKETQIFIACQQALFKLDSPLISYHLIDRWYPSWMNIQPPSEELDEISRNILKIKARVEKELNHPMAQRFYAVCEKYDTPYLLLGDIISKNPMEAENIIQNPEMLESAVKEAYEKRLYASKSKVRRAAIYSTLSIFITKVLLVLLVDIWWRGVSDFVALGVDVAIPPLLMAALVLTIRPPSRENLQRVILETARIAYETEQKPKYLVRPPRSRNAIISLFVSLFYLISFILSFGAIIWFLNKLNFDVLSQVIFLMFVSLVSFAGVKIRQRSRELVIQEEKGAFWVGILELLALPIIQTGKWLSGKLARYNVIIVLINALVEMPLQIFFEFFEQWRYFLKEKKEEIR